MFKAIGKLCTGWCVLMLLASTADALTDPTRPTQYRAPVSQVHFQLESILFSDSRRVAVINGKVLAEGEHIGGAKVLSISKNTVRLQRDGKITSLSLQQPTIRQEK